MLYILNIIINMQVLPITIFYVMDFKFRILVYMYAFYIFILFFMRINLYSTVR